MRGQLLPAIADGILLVGLGLCALGLGAAASALAEPTDVARLTTSPNAARSVAPGTAVAEDGASVRLRDATRDVPGGIRRADAIPPGWRGDERTISVGTLAMWDASYEPRDVQIELVHTASAARKRPLALLYIEQDWNDLVASTPAPVEGARLPQTSVGAAAP